MRKPIALLAGVTMSLALAAPAWAHVTVSTDNQSAGGYAVYTVRVPNEEERASTTKVEVRMPERLEASRYQPNQGWNMTLQDGVLTARGGEIRPGQFEEFRFQARNPEEPVDLAFPAIQTYGDGEVVEWIGKPDSDTPASVVEIVPVDDAEPVAADVDDGGDSLTYLALGAGVLALIVALAALARGGRRT